MLLLSEASNSCKKRKILHGNPPHLRSRNKTSPGKNSALSASQTMPFIHVGACIYPVFITRGWHDSSKKEQRRIIRNGQRKVRITAEDVISSLKGLFHYGYVPFERGLFSPGPEQDVQEWRGILLFIPGPTALKE